MSQKKEKKSLPWFSFFHQPTTTIYEDTCPDIYLRNVFTVQRAAAAAGCTISEWLTATKWQEAVFTDHSHQDTYWEKAGHFCHLPFRLHGEQLCSIALFYSSLIITKFKTHFPEYENLWNTRDTFALCVFLENQQIRNYSGICKIL